jgi:hypothetical protein
VIGKSCNDCRCERLCRKKDLGLHIQTTALLLAHIALVAIHSACPVCPVTSRMQPLLQMMKTEPHGNINICRLLLLVASKL